MSIIVGIFIFVLGACLGSFFNVVIERGKRGEDFIFKPSHCDRCQKKIHWFDNIPLLSFAILRGKCRFCKTKIGHWHLIMEVLTGGLFLVWWLVAFSSLRVNEVGVVIQTPDLINYIFWLVIATLFLVIIVADLRYMIIPNWTLVTMLGSILLWFTWLAFDPSLRAEGTVISSSTLLFGALAGLLASGFFYLLDIVALKIWKKPGMGMGDVKLVFVLAILIFLSTSSPWQMLFLMLMTAFFSGAAVGILVKIFSKKRGKAVNVVPFGPFLILGTIVALVWGRQLLEFYINLI
ncbi:MAG: prepilin peptidase [Pseudomonadales bacterium]|jgi:prepilin signal peptidase PulO-like enzyme (type II secretory pathway)|nr:prepilin peptidase [Pseudomonadales bacterium]